MIRNFLNYLAIAELEVYDKYHPNILERCFTTIIDERSKGTFPHDNRIAIRSAMMQMERFVNKANRFLSIRSPPKYFIFSNQWMGNFVLNFKFYNPYGSYSYFFLLF